MTFAEELKEYTKNTPGDILNYVDWFKSYLKDFAESVKLEEKEDYLIGRNTDPEGQSYEMGEQIGYNQAKAELDSKIQEQLTNRGI